MIWIYIFTPILAIITWLLFAPLYIRFNTIHNTYTAGLKGVLKISLIPDEVEYIFIQVRILVFNSTFYPFKPVVKKKKKKKNKKKARSRKNRFAGLFIFRIIFKLAINAINSWKINTFKVNIDTSDVIKNAYLIPIFVGLNTKKNINFTVNYQEKISAELDVQNNIFRLLRLFLLTYIKLKKWKST